MLLSTIIKFTIKKINSLPNECHNIPFLLRKVSRTLTNDVTQSGVLRVPNIVMLGIQVGIKLLLDEGKGGLILGSNLHDVINECYSSMTYNL